MFLINDYHLFRLWNSACNHQMCILYYITKFEWRLLCQLNYDHIYGLWNSHLIINYASCNNRINLKIMPMLEIIQMSIIVIILLIMQMLIIMVLLSSMQISIIMPTALSIHIFTLMQVFACGTLRRIAKGCAKHSTSKKKTKNMQNNSSVCVCVFTIK